MTDQNGLMQTLIGLRSLHMSYVTFSYVATIFFFFFFLSADVNVLIKTGLL